MEEFDYVVVGAGSAGCVLADRLSEGGATVAVIEAGGPDRHPWIHVPAGYSKILTHPELTWQYRTEAEPGTADRVMDYPRGRVWGGCSSINGLGHIRGHPSDYDLWAQKGATGWGWDAMLPHFRRAERYRPQPGETPHAERGLDGAMPIQHLAERPPLLDRMIAAAESIGLPWNPDQNGAAREGIGCFQQTRRGRLRVSAARAFLHPALRRPNLRVIDRALALRVVLEHGRAAGVAIRRGGAEQVVRARREVILAAGAVNSPKLLMLSGLGPGEWLREHGIDVACDIPGVGRNLQDHYCVRLSWRLAAAHWSANRRIAGWRLGLEAARWLLRGDGALGWSPGMLSLFARTHDGLEAPDVQMNGGPLSWEGGRTGTPERAPGVTVGVWVCRPDSRGTVQLASADPAAAPRIAPNFLAAQHDRDTTLRGLRLARRWLASPALRDVVVGETRPGPDAADDDALLDFARRTGGTVFHPCGTVRMGGADAPLDPALRLRGVDGLRVVDASAFPDIPVCNINATVLAVAERGAELILAG